MNRIVLIGNGFDLAHGLKTRYEDFINWYCDLRVYGFVGNLSEISSDILCSFQDLRHQVWYAIEESAKDNLHELNLQLQYVQSRLTECLMGCQLGATIISQIGEKIYSPIKINERQKW